VSSKVENYQARAAHCLQLAQSITDERSKALLLEMAQTWLNLAEQIRKREGGSSGGASL
jgi:hypothetical protein